MKTILFKSLVLLFFLPILGASQSSSKKAKVFNVKVVKSDKQVVKGFLLSADSTGIYLIHKPSAMNSKDYVKIKATNIYKIKIRRRGSVAKGVLFGGLGGFGFGMLIGQAEGDDDPGWFSMSKEEKGLISGIMLGVVGTGVGALIGTSSNKIIVASDKELYLKHLARLQQYTIKIPQN